MQNRPSLQFSSLMTQDERTEQALAHARYCIRKNIDTLWIEGECGTGKSTVAHTICAQTFNQQDLPIYDVCSVSIPSRSTLQSHIKPLAQRGIILHISIQPNVKLIEIESFQQQLVKHLSDNDLTVKLLCFMTPPIHSFSTHIFQHLEMMQELFIEDDKAIIKLPSLKEKQHDIPLLAQHFLRQKAYIENFGGITFCKEAKAILKELDWSRNIKDLQQFCHYLAEIDGVSVVQKNHVLEAYNTLFHSQRLQDDNSRMVMQKASMMVPLLDSHGNLRSFSELEEEIFRLACMHRKGSKSNAARELGIGRTTLYRKLKNNQNAS